jgi:hypothetical protein
VEALTVETRGCSGGLEPEEQNILADEHRGQAVPRIEPVDAHSASCSVAQHHVDPPLPDDFKDRAPDIVREPVDAVGILLLPLIAEGGTLATRPGFGDLRSVLTEEAANVDRR